MLAAYRRTSAHVKTGLNLTHLLHDFSPRVLRSSALRRLSERGTLRIGYLPARPWIYRSGAGLEGHDATAAMRLAQSLKVQVWFVECRASDLASFWLAAKSTWRSAAWSITAGTKCGASRPGT